MRIKLGQKIIDVLRGKKKNPALLPPAPARFELVDRKPIRADEFHVLQNEFRKAKTLTIVMQGPVKYEHDFTLETLKIYKKTFPNCPVIVSTWETEKEETLRQIEALGCAVIRNAPPETVGIDNVNYQIKSTQAGLKKAKESGAKYVIKTRTDQRLYETHIAEYLFNLLKMFPLAPSVTNQKERLFTLSLNTFKYRLYDISDMFLFGNIDDVIRFWSMGYEKRKILPEWKDLAEYSRLRPSEIGFTVDYLEKIGETLDYTLKNSWEMYRKYFCVIDSSSLGLYWPKHSNLVSRWRNFFGENELLEELTFKEWLNIYSGLDNMIPPEEITQKKY